MASTSGQDGLREGFQHLNHLQSKREEVVKWSRKKKLKTLSAYSKCKAEGGCFCEGFSAHESGRSTESFDEICQVCGHEMSAHISHFKSAPDEELNIFLNIHLDIKLLLFLCKEEDSDKKQVYYAYLKKLVKCVQEKKRPATAEEYLSNPPFEKPSIAEAVSNFVEYKFSHRPASEYEAMLEVSKLFRANLSHLDLPSVKACQGLKSQEEMNEYEVNYKRWLHFCYIPSFCKSLEMHVTTDIFGRNFLKFIYDASQHRLLNKLESQGNKVANKQQMIIANTKMFLSMLREEVFNSASPIWNIDFKQKYRGDVPMDVITNIVKTIKDPGKMVCPEAASFFDKKSFFKHAEEERKGILKCYIIGNSLKRKVSDQCLIWLIELQKLISRQLEFMQKEYITRLLFDPKHKAIILLRNNVLIGGICFCIFPTQGFSEIVFCVVASSDQSKGYGEYMMHKMKDYHVKNNILHLLTYADDGAIKFFEKQGFSPDIKLEESRYSGYIKDYTESKFMHCELNPLIVYSQFEAVINQQKEIVKELIEMKQNEEPIVYPGLTFFKNGVREIPCDDIPGLKEAGFRPLKRPHNELSPEQLHSSLDNLLQQVMRHTYSWPFLEPVETKAMIYQEQGKYPMDLQTMSERMEKRYYCSKHLFIADMQRIFNNCRSMNRRNSDYYKCADVLEQFFRNKLKELGL